MLIMVSLLAHGGDEMFWKSFKVYICKDSENFLVCKAGTRTHDVLVFLLIIVP